MNLINRKPAKRCIVDEAWQVLLPTKVIHFFNNRLQLRIKNYELKTRNLKLETLSALKGRYRG
jgi:hypothetical protein